MHVQVADVWFLRVNLQTLSEPERLRAAQERIGDEDEPWTRKSAESSSSSSSCTQSTKLGPVHGPSSDEAARVFSSRPQQSECRASSSSSESSLDEDDADITFPVDSQSELSITVETILLS